MKEGLKIILDVVAFRLRRLEMANLAGGGSIALVLGLPWSEVTCRLGFAFLLNILVYLNNDYLDVTRDMHSGEKDRAQTEYLAQHLNEARRLQWLLLAALALLAGMFAPGLLLTLVAGGGIGLWYSAHLKRLPFVDVAAALIGGTAMTLAGTPLNCPLGLAMAVQLGLFSGVFEAIQVLRDAETDSRCGLRTTAVLLGPVLSGWLIRLLIALSATYALLFLHPFVAGLLAVALVLPVNGSAAAYWTRVKLLFGLAWLVFCLFTWKNGQSAGLWIALVPSGRWR